MTRTWGLLSQLALMLGTVGLLLAAGLGHPGSAATARAASRPHPAQVPPVRRPLAGMTVGIDPGHDGGNGRDPAAIDRLIWNGREEESCDTAGTETDAGYSEARFTFAVALALRADLRREGARVVMTRRTNTGVGPCVSTRAQIINRAHARIAIDIHGDGGPPDGRGFAILTPVPDGPNDRIIAGSLRFARILRARFHSGTGMPVSTYDGVDGLAPRDDLAGLNLATQPKVLIECGNMRNATDAALMTSPRFQTRAAAAMAAAITLDVKDHPR